MWGEVVFSDVPGEPVGGVSPALVCLFDLRRVAVPLLGRSLIKVSERLVSEELQGLCGAVHEMPPFAHFVSVRCS